MADLLASAPTKEALGQSITAFYCGTRTYLIPQGDDVWQVARESDCKILPGVIVRRKGKRFRFEMVPL